MIAACSGASRPRSRRNRWGAAIAAPFLWTGLEYFRSEVYYLRFSWLNVGYAFSDSPQASLVFGLGVYGIGFALMAAAALVSALPGRIRRATGLLLLVLLGVLTNFPEQDRPENRQPSGSYVDQVHQTRSSERESAPSRFGQSQRRLMSAATVHGAENCRRDARASSASIPAPQLVTRNS